MSQRVNWVLDADIRSFFDSVDHEWLLRMVAHRIADSGLVSGFMGATPVTGQFLALSDDRQRAFVAHVVERLVGYVDDAGLAVPQENHFLTASKAT
jgi:hypothetical protein